MTDSSPRPTPSAPLKVVPARYPLRLLGAVFALFILLAIVQSVATNPRWEWAVFRQWFFNPVILEGLGRTLLLTLLGTVFGIIFGTLLALARLSKSYLLNSLAWAYIWLFRSLPLLLVLIVLYNFSYLYDNLSLGIPFTSIEFFKHPTVDLLDQFTVAVIGLSAVQSAYTAEIIRGGIVGVEQGQHEAAAALGLPGYRRTFRIILPQALRAIIPTGFNEVIGLAKGTSIVYVLAMPDLFYTVQVLYNRSQQVIPMLMVATVWYLVITTVLSVLQYYVERYFSRGATRQVAPTPLQRLRLWRTAKP
ncbi:amino acid ABC transporter permease [Rouxiella badensis]|jgi:polar amino acid transport system permease protein|uniref:Amino acid ABC transporter permease n=1 Tax=Rouxiella badensis TaxID=1646377 RepID=A0A1X0WFZ0_9GAMM|nr:amino acid ABC transporter permease [Rouxiella badensis]MCC3705048.1 amino acid ABC transporter permease [Rouxiella badensis]MCC3721069.1 amino acid ABC transporter permease [Rouxiella badensis]MCC3730840.1 amino acid ABC transporter permease [Rouxiella badensis]MCC3735306.1 amino acid ABC transporter permease [Rouxiella badensis]MCC3742634.1 amino acid ABC transporter permease [Rouxiella badensis]